MDHATTGTGASVSLNQRVIGGVVGGIAGGLVFGAMMALMGMLTTVAGVVGRVRVPAANGQPYVKQ